MTRPQCECAWSVVDENSKCVSTYTSRGETIHQGCGKHRDDHDGKCTMCRGASPDFEVCSACVIETVERAQSVASKVKR